MLKTITKISASATFLLTNFKFLNTLVILIPLYFCMSLSALFRFSEALIVPITPQRSVIVAKKFGVGYGSNQFL
jgi:hypothetical protein